MARFCDRYPSWRDSLASQLQYHALLSRVVAPQPAPPRFPEPGEYFQEFQILQELGRGGAGRVYRARDESLGGREVALKVSPDRGHEASIIGRLDHAHIVKVHSVVFQSETRLRGICMPYRPGLPLDEVIRRIDRAPGHLRAQAIRDVLAKADAQDDAVGDPFGDHAGWDGFPSRGSFAEGVAWIVAVLARALGYAHSQRIWHRDVKPANVLLASRDGPQLLDFNLAHDPHSIDQAEAALRGGTLPYMAPEQLEAFRDPACWDRVGGPADLYSLGLVLRELLTGEPPATPDPSLPLHRAIASLLDDRAALRDASSPFPPGVPRAGGDHRALPGLLARRPISRRPGFGRRPPAVHRPPTVAGRRQPVAPRAPGQLGPSPPRLGRRGGRPGRPHDGGRLQDGAPLERDRAFLAAVDDINQNRHPEGLRPLVERYSDRPLAWLYLAIEYDQRDLVKDAVHAFSRAMTHPNATRDILAWGRRTRKSPPSLSTWAKT